MPKGSDEGLHTKVLQAYAKVPHPAYKRYNKRPLGFILVHYAGEVRYDMGGFLEKNKGRLEAARYLTRRGRDNGSDPRPLIIVNRLRRAAETKTKEPRNPFVSQDRPQQRKAVVLGVLTLEEHDVNLVRQYLILIVKQGAQPFHDHSVMRVPTSLLDQAVKKPWDRSMKSG